MLVILPPGLFELEVFRIRVEYYPEVGSTTPLAYKEQLFIEHWKIGRLRRYGKRVLRLKRKVEPVTHTKKQRHN